MKNFREFLKEEMKNPTFKKEWDALEVEFWDVRQSLDSKMHNTSSRKPLKEVINERTITIDCYR